MDDERANPPPTPAPRRGLAWAALGFGLAALLSAWQPLSAPFGLAVGLASTAIALRALRAGGRPRPAVVGLVLSLAAVAVSGTVLGHPAGALRTGQDTAPLPGPPAARTSEALDGAAAGSEAARQRARLELEALEKAGPPPPAR